MAYRELKDKEAGEPGSHENSSCVGLGSTVGELIKEGLVAVEDELDEDVGLEVLYMGSSAEEGVEAAGFIGGYEVRFLKMMLTRIRAVTRSLLTIFLTMSW